MEETHNNNTQRLRCTIRIGVVLLIIASLLASSASARPLPLSRSLKSMIAAPRVNPDSSAQDTRSWNFGGYGEEEEEEEEEERRMLVETTNDYGTTGANNKHDPPKRS